VPSWHTALGHAGRLRLIHDGIGQVLKRSIVETGAAPGASAFIAAHRDGRWRSAWGVAGTYSGEDRRLVEPDTVYDLASLTKPIVAATLARMVCRGAVAWDTRLGDVLVAARGTPSATLPLELFASHRAGLEAHVRLGQVSPGAGVTRWLELCAGARRSDCAGDPPSEGFAPVYSDLGYILIGAALESLGGAPLDRLVAREVAEPLGLDVASAAGWIARLGAAPFERRVAPTEVVPERGGPIKGRVHDDNAWDLAGLGTAGHAGLFGLARDVAGLGIAMVDALAARTDAWIGSREAELMTRPRPGGSQLAGFDGMTPNGSAGARFGLRSFGHLGFTGTSLWCDPDADVVVVLLTNRVCPTRENILIRSIRPDVHGALFGLSAGLDL
jgi:serine-type D-Ala-D-Ala carboxypeptidase